MNYLKDSHGASLVGVSNHLLADQTRIRGGNGGDPGLDLKSKEEQIRTCRNNSPIRVEIVTDNVFASYFVPVIVLSVAVGSRRGLLISLVINSSLQILNQNPEGGLIKTESKHLM